MCCGFVGDGREVLFAFWKGSGGLRCFKNWVGFEKWYRLAIVAF